jgi:RHS repeat-associated protein
MEQNPAGLSLLNTYELGDYITAGSVSFKEENLAYFTSRSLDASAGNRIQSIDVATGTITEIVNCNTEAEGSEYGDIRLGSDGSLYAGNRVTESIKKLPAGSDISTGNGYLGVMSNSSHYATKLAETTLFARNIGHKEYELKDHLGNVRALVSDIKEPVLNSGFVPTLLAYNNYYPFGSEMPGRNYAGSNAYRFGFNGKEKDDEWTGTTGATYDYGFRIYDSRVARFLSVDPLAAKYPDLSPYSAFANNPILLIDADGQEPTRKGSIGVNALISVLNANHISSLEGLQHFYRGSFNYNQSRNSNAESSRYLYSQKWGWVDMKHFSVNANQADNILIPQSYLLNRGEGLEQQQEKSEPSSAWDYEDLASNLLGVYFEEWLGDQGPMSDNEFDAMIKQGDNLFTFQVRKYLNELGFSDKPLEDKPQNNVLPENENTEVDKSPKTNYTPRYSTKSRSGEADKKLIKFAKSKDITVKE